MTEENHAVEPDNRHSVDQVTDHVLAQARREFDLKQERIKELIHKGIEAYNDVENYASLHRKSQATLETVVNDLSELQIERKVLADALGIGETSLARRLPAKKRRQRSTRTAKRDGSSRGSKAGSDALVSGTQDSSLPNDQEMISEH